MPWKKRDEHMLVVGLEAKLLKGADSSKLLLAIFQTQNMWILDLFGMKNTYFLIGIAYWVWIYFSDISSKVYDLHLNFSDVLKYMTNKYFNKSFFMKSVLIDLFICSEFLRLHYKRNQFTSMFSLSCEISCYDI